MTNKAPLSPDESARYARHLMLPEVGAAGQAKLKAARVLIVGIGGLGSPAALYLAAAGIGALGMADDDCVALSNLQRQILYSTEDAGQPKTGIAAQKLAGLNPHIAIHTHAEKITAANALGIIADYDLVIDGTDNFVAHYLLNDACVLGNKPLIYGAVQKFSGMVSLVTPRQSACYRCLHPAPPPAHLAPSCDAAGVLGVVPGIVGMLQATEAIKHILGIGDSLAGRMLRVDTLTMKFQDFALTRDIHCAVCGNTPRITELSAPALESCMKIAEITAADLKSLLNAPGAPFLLDVRQPEEYAEHRIEGATLIPLPELPQRLGELNPAQDIVVYCKLGGRSAKAAEIMLASGFSQVRNLRGGIMAYEAI